MRHRKNNVKFGRSKSHREALVAMLAVGLVKAKSIRTTDRKAKVARSFAEKLVTVARKGTLAARRQVAAKLRDEAAAKELFEKIVPMMEGRQGGYTRIVKLGQRAADGAEPSYSTPLSLVTVKGLKDFQIIFSLILVAINNEIPEPIP